MKNFMPVSNIIPNTNQIDSAAKKYNKILSFQKGDKNNFDSVASLESVSIPSKLAN